MTNWTATRAPPGHLGSAASRQHSSRGSPASSLAQGHARQAGFSRYLAGRGRSRRGRAHTRVARACRPEQEKSYMGTAPRQAQGTPRTSLARRQVGRPAGHASERPYSVSAREPGCCARASSLLALTWGDDMCRTAAPNSSSSPSLNRGIEMTYKFLIGPILIL